MDLRLKRHPVLDINRGNIIRFFFNGTRFNAYEGETIAAALWANGIKVLHHSVKYNRPRGFFCGIGKCSSCLMTVNGIPNVKSCIEPVKEGMITESQKGRGQISFNHETDAASLQKEGKRSHIETNVAIVGAGPAGLKAAILTSQLGLDTVLIDENPRPGGQLIKQTHKFFGQTTRYAGIRGVDIAKNLLRNLQDTKTKLLTGASALAYYENTSDLVVSIGNDAIAEINPEKVIIATGSMENFLAFPNNDLPGVCGAGGIQTLVNVYGIKPGKNALVIGSGNVGLIVSYQLIQAGVNVKAVLESKPNIGGYLVHASKLRRMRVPIYTSHTIKRAIGRHSVEGATMVALDGEGIPIEGSEQNLEVDLICLAVGLTPSSELAFQAGCASSYIPELGGYVAVHNRDLRTTKEDVYVAGDASGIEDADSATIEGEIAGADVAISLGEKMKKAEKMKIKAHNELALLRENRFNLARIGKKKVWTLMEE